MKKNYYIFSPGKLVRRSNTLYFIQGKQEEPLEVENTEEEFAVEELEENSSDELVDELEPQKLTARPIPVEDIDSIYCFSDLRLNTKFLNFVAQKGITVFFFNYYGFYSGSFVSRESNVSGKLIVEQTKQYIDNDKRIEIAKKFVYGASANILKNLNYYNSRGAELKNAISKIENLRDDLEGAKAVEVIMGIEGNIRNEYYANWKNIISDEFEFEKRSKRPPQNPLNALISFGNSLVYTTVLAEIHKTQLSPLISFLHQPGTSRFSLSLDISEIFKPLLTDRIIFALLNKKILQPKHFDRSLNYCYLKEEGRKLYLKEFDEKLKVTIKHRSLKRSVSYRQLIRLECYKLIKHILGDKEYKPFVIWW